MKLGNLVDKAKKGFYIGMAGATGLAALIGCTPTPQGRAFMMGLGEAAAYTAVQEGVKKQMGHEDYREEEDPLNNQSQQQFPECIDFITFTAYRDINGNGTADREEFFGENKEEFSLSGDIFHAAFFNQSNRSGIITFKSWTEYGEFVGETKLPYEPYEVVLRRTGKDMDTNSRDYLDMIKLRGPGKYRLTATINSGKTFVKDIKFLP